MLLPQSNVEYLLLNLANVASVRSCVEAVLAQQRPVHYLVLNAGARSWAAAAHLDPADALGRYCIHAMARDGGRL